MASLFAASINDAREDGDDAAAPLLVGEVDDGVVDDGGDAGGKSGTPAESAPAGVPLQSRVQTVASIVNTMMGTTILALPFGVAQAGIATALAITGLLGAVSCFTCLVVVERGLTAGRDDFSGSVEAFLGRRAQLVAWAFSVAIILGASIVYHILMQETLYALVATVLAAAGRPLGAWSRVYAALVPWAIYPVCNLQNLSALVRFNSVGFLFLGSTVVFICYHGAHALAAAAHGAPGGAAPIEFVHTLPAGASPWTADGSFRVVTLGSPAFAGHGGRVRGGGGARARARCCRTLLSLLLLLPPMLLLPLLRCFCCWRHRCSCFRGNSRRIARGACMPPRRTHLSSAGLTPSTPCSTPHPADHPSA